MIRNITSTGTHFFTAFSKHNNDNDNDNNILNILANLRFLHGFLDLPLGRWRVSIWKYCCRLSCRLCAADINRTNPKAMRIY